MAKQDNKKQTSAKSASVAEEGNGKPMPFGKVNYLIVLAGVLLIALGMILMIGGGSSDPDVFNEKMFDFQHITLAPILILLGFVVEIVAIFWKGKK